MHRETKTHYYDKNNNFQPQPRLPAVGSGKEANQQQGRCSLLQQGLHHPPAGDGQQKPHHLRTPKGDDQIKRTLGGAHVIDRLSGKASAPSILLTNKSITLKL